MPRGRPKKKPVPETTKQKGAPTKYRPEYDLTAEYMARSGMTDGEIADKLKVTEQTLNNWKKDFPSFFESLKRGKENVDAQVENSLLRMANGYVHDVEKPVVVGDGMGESHVEIVKYTERLPPNPTSMIFWLKNRQPAKWRDKQEIEMTGPLEIKHTVDPKGV